MRRPILLLIGLPGSGKSTWAQRFVRQFPRYEILSTDQTRAALYGDAAVQGDWPDVWRALEQQLRDGHDRVARGQLDGLIWDATNAKRDRRRQLIQSLRRMGFTEVGAVWFCTPLADCLARNAGRSRQVPVAVILRMHRQLVGGAPAIEDGLDWLAQLR